MPKKEKILFVGQNMNIGGVQKAFVNQLNEAAKNAKYDITVFVFSKGILTSELANNIKVIEGNRVLKLISMPIVDVKATGNKILLFIRIAFSVMAKIIGSEHFYRLCFKKMPQKYDVAISYFNDVPAGVFNKGTNIYVTDYVNADKKMAWVHTDPILNGFDRKYCLKIYKRFDKILCVSDAVKEKFNMLLPEYKDKTQTHYNVFDKEKINVLAGKFEPFEKSDFDIVTVAREDNSSKRIDDIIKICKRLKDEGITDFRWRIIGAGPDLDKNRELAKTLGVDKMLLQPGEKSNPYPYIKKSDLFALYSAYEGFPIVIGESLILDTPILTTNYAAAKEQISNDKGIIAKNDEDFFNILKNLIITKTSTCI